MERGVRVLPSRPSLKRRRVTARRAGSAACGRIFEFQSWLLRLGVYYLTGGSDVGYILSDGRGDVKQLRELIL
jgi:hypothetical protein